MCTMLPAPANPVAYSAKSSLVLASLMAEAPSLSSNVCV